MKSNVIAIIIIVLVLGGGFYFADSLKNKETPEINTVVPTKEQNMKTKIVIDSKTLYTARVSTTLGDFTMELNKGETPKTVNNFVSLASKGFYTDTIFHRVIKDFMIQGGDPTGTGSGGPGYKFEDEPFTGSYTKGTVAMANAGPNTNGSQFFIMHNKVDLPPNYTIFGHVTDGLDVIDKIAEQEVVQSETGESSKPVNPTKIISVKITPKVTLK